MSPRSNPRPPTSSGRVFLVGAGPGDPGLITVAALECLRGADVVVYDRLANPSLLEEARLDAEMINVGKEGGGPSMEQAAINRILVEKARDGKRVVRLKGGDPFVFGRGGEEAGELRAAGVPFGIVPGVTSAIAVPAYAGIPVTHRGVATSFAVVTGHEDPSKEESGVRWDRIANAADTLVFLMGIKTLPDIVKNLVANGRPATTPAAVIHRGTTPEQRTVTGTLAGIVRRVEEEGIAPPAITVVGEVVRLRETLSWFEDRPLFGKRVLITRTREQASVLAEMLVEDGAIPVEMPSIEIEPLLDSKVLAKTIEELARADYQWIVFTSANAVGLFFSGMWELGFDARVLGATDVAVIGRETAQALAIWGIFADLIPEDYIAESLVEAFRENFDMKGQRVLLPRAEGARQVLVQGLQEQGAKVKELTLYRSAVPKEVPAEVLSLLREGRIDILTFTSSSTVRNLVAMLGDDAHVILSGNGARAEEGVTSRRNLGGEAGSARGTERARRPLVACIGPVTADTARELGLTVDVTATEHTVEGLVAALREHRP